MMRFLRYLFGAGNAAGSRTVAGNQESMPMQDLPYIKDSNKRLLALQQLYERFKSTAYARKVFAVYEKSKRIHAYLVSRNRLQELEVFHLQYTDHFISTYTTILDARQQRTQATQKTLQEQHQQKPQPPNRASGKPEVIGRTFVLGPFRRETKEVKASRQQAARQAAAATIPAHQTEVPTLRLPVISIDTFSKIVYLRDDILDGFTSNEIGYTSSDEEKEAFLTYVAARFGISNLTYIGNTMLHLPASDAENQLAEMLPVVHWNGAPYALHLDDARIFPVSTFWMAKSSL